MSDIEPYTEAYRNSVNYDEYIETIKDLNLDEELAEELWNELNNKYKEQ